MGTELKKAIKEMREKKAAEKAHKEHTARTFARNRCRKLAR